MGKRRCGILHPSTTAALARTTMSDRLLEPALRTPSGVTSQFPTTHSSVQVWFYVIGTLFAVVPGTLLLLRLYTKWRIVRKLDLIDGLTLSTPIPITLNLIQSLGLATASFVSFIESRGTFTTLLTCSISSACLGCSLLAYCVSPGDLGCINGICQCIASSQSLMYYLLLIRFSDWGLIH